MTARGRVPRLRPALIALLTENRLAAWQMADMLGYRRKTVQEELRNMKFLGLACMANLLDGRAIKRRADDPPLPAVAPIARQDVEPKGPTADEVVTQALRTRHPLDGWLR